MNGNTWWNEFLQLLRDAWDWLAFAWRSELYHQTSRSWQWQRVRAKHLQQFPTCAACGARSKLEVHHIKPYLLFSELELDPLNLVTLCENPGFNCHRIFGHGGDYAKYWNPNVLNDVLWFNTIVLSHRRAYELGRG